MEQGRGRKCGGAIEMIGAMPRDVCGLTQVVWWVVLRVAQPALLKQVDSEGKTVLHVVAHSGKCEDLVDLFVDRGGPELIEAKDAAGNDCMADAPPNVKGRTSYLSRAHACACALVLHTQRAHAQAL